MERRSLQMGTYPPRLGLGRRHSPTSFPYRFAVEFDAYSNTGFIGPLSYRRHWIPKATPVSGFQRG